MKKLRSQLLAHRRPRKKWSPGAIPREFFRVSAGWWRHASVGVPFGLLRSAIKDSSFVPWSDRRVYTIVGEALLRVIDEWGPLYGKALQVWFSRLGPAGQALIEKMGLDRVYGDWPAMPWTDVQRILDIHTPRWRDELKVEPRPLGVASMSQVHGAVDSDGQRWVVKVLKPRATARLQESIAAVEAAMSVAEPFAITLMAKRFLKDVQGLCDGFRREMDLSLERETMQRVHEMIAQKRAKVLHVPALHPVLHSKNVIVMERLDGVKLSDVVAGREELSPAMRKSLARKVLSELLVQIFEWGLFHADPHAGNLMLLDDGTVGLYDWGLAGELLEADRRFIAGVLKSVMALDIEKLIDVLQVMGRESRGIIIQREQIQKELQRLIQMIKNSQAEKGKIPPFQELVEAALEGAERLRIPVPNGLLLMVKSILTIEGLAKGIDADVSFARVAGPVLFWAARPEISDILAMAKQLPRAASNWIRKSK